MVYILLAPGFEEIEALAPADLMRRAGLEVALVSVNGTAQVAGSHSITVAADCTLDQVDPARCQLLMLPGGLGGVNGIKASPAALKLVETVHSQGVPVAAICAAPTVLGQLGLLQGRQAVCYPGMEDGLTGASVPAGERVVVDGTVITGQAVGSSLDFGLTLIETLLGRDKAEEVQQGVCYR